MGTGSSGYFACHVCALARHYELFEQLPQEQRGRGDHSHSLLKQEGVHAAAQNWLMNQTIGMVTPKKFHAALQDEILLSLSVIFTKPPCEQTATRWMIKLGWQMSVVRKGVYMDGHERADVVKYQQEIFLPKLAELEPRIACYVPNPETGKLERVEPDLAPGEKEIIPLWQDETCCQANEHASSAWLHEDQQPLRKKSRGQLIHFSDLIEQVSGWLIVKNENGTVIKSARKIIFPGSNGDPWWDCQQLIEQVRTQAIPIFEEAHPGCQAVFFFDQSSAHAALPPDALKAFETNKGNGRKQRRQRNTVIPMSNPYPEHRGKTQKMMTDDGLPKGLQQTLEERGFTGNDLPKRAKCSPVCPWDNYNCCMARLLSRQEDFYWGWCKFRYRQMPKNTFEDAKAAAYKAFDACPDDVIRHFINRSWRFISAYRVGLTGKAAAWAVRKQKGHRSVSQSAMMHLEAILT
ncbi:hypothetical protein AN958_05341 [Leucoagaricus sp. SymC.cos]|nr:hypothetical protein AN958_05341 [Leucoagaricus sp. SymC.cos]